MAVGKKKVIVYTDWIIQFKDLTDEEAGKLIKHFFNYINTFIIMQNSFQYSLGSMITQCSPSQQA